MVGEGRGAMQGGAFASGSGTDAYYRDGTTFTMHVIFRINDGTKNFDKIVFVTYTRELTHDVISQIVKTPQKGESNETFLVGIYALVVMSSVGVQAGHHEGEGEKQGVVIGTVFPDEGSP